MMREPRVLLASAFEGGAQPIDLGTAANHLLRAGFEPTCLDVFVEGPPEGDAFADVDLLAISMQLFQAVEPRVELAKIARGANPGITIAMFGQHANIHAERLLGRYCDYVIRGDWEPALVALAKMTAGRETTLAAPGLCGPGRVVGPYINRTGQVPPARDMLPSLAKYTYPELEHIRKGAPSTGLVANVETARGCHHACSYCSVFAATGRKVNLVPSDIVLEDIRAVSRLGAHHIWFTDAEFLNAKHHGIRIVRQMKEEFPYLTFDITTRADHILESRDTIGELHELGCEFVTTALEFPAQRVLDAVDKELTLEQIEAAVAYCHDLGLTMNPTFILFNPWITLEDLSYFREWLDRVGLAETVSPLQFETRLYFYKGSPLLKHPDVQALELIEHEFHYDWKHPDPRVDEVFATTVKPPEPGVFKRCCIKC
jgi:radical SAM superfamily enzyme YgiQ (UPF0313 family)